MAITRRLLVLQACTLGIAVAAASATPDDKPKRKRKAEEYALLFGTVFDESGRTARGIRLRVREKDGKKKWDAVSDARGEFAVHLPAGAHSYRVEVAADGFSSESQEVIFVSDERQDISVRVQRNKK